jgi:hypothetical protein
MDPGGRLVRKTRSCAGRAGFSNGTAHPLRSTIFTGDGADTLARIMAQKTSS